VVGDGPLRGQLEALAMGLPVMFVGHLENRAWVATILAGARAIIAPCGTETFGLAVLEAMACGTPAIVPMLPPSLNNSRRRVPKSRPFRRDFANGARSTLRQRRPRCVVAAQTTRWG